jgi:hypothetical protein
MLQFDETAWHKQKPEQVAAYPEVESVLVDSHWSVREVVLKSGERLRRGPIVSVKSNVRLTGRDRS